MPFSPRPHSSFLLLPFLLIFSMANTQATKPIYYWPCQCQPPAANRQLNHLPYHYPQHSLQVRAEAVEIGSCSKLLNPIIEKCVSLDFDLRKETLNSVPSTICSKLSKYSDCLIDAKLSSFSKICDEEKYLKEEIDWLNSRTHHQHFKGFCKAKHS